MAFPKDRADKAEQFRAALERLRARGEIDRILEHWHDEHSDAPQMGQ